MFELRFIEIANSAIGYFFSGLLILHVSSCDSRTSAEDGIPIVSVTSSSPDDDGLSEIDSDPNRIICWHGKIDYEFVVSYNRQSIEGGLNLSGQITTKPWDNLPNDLADNSLKMCSFDGEWYGQRDPSPWFPLVSFVQLFGDTFSVCENSPVCAGTAWSMTKGIEPPQDITDLIGPIEGSENQIVGYALTNSLDL